MNGSRLRVLSKLIISNNWKPKDIIDFLDSSQTLQALIYASVILESEEIKKQNNKMRKR